jgi:GNAT superfamily N-acetyltransferase
LSTQTDILHAALAPPTPPKAPRWLPVSSLGPRQRTRVLAHLLALGDDDRHLRFGQIATDEQIRSYVDHIDFARDEVFGIFDTRLRLVAMAHLAFAQDHRSAEFGVSVLPHQRSRGFGARLFEHAVVHARNRGARSMAIHLARENGPMLAIVRHSGAGVRFEGSDVVADLPLPEDTLGTQLGALMETQAAEWDYRLKLQVLRLDNFWHGLLPHQLPRT